ncbi:PilW family protein [Luteimonas sp. RD2P54]|uniref:PilW family protein n=1 Tax=Luteimonas endophytica TaxID=3042023 RepID=A0ABT6JAI3_9GAMM|nr:PilW family protein [Luteimonas endophytica]MDH5823827.1 PilW family protein [Luteimonas endophytica]
MSTYSRHRSIQGLSLIEIMIALAIGTVLVLGLVQVFAASRTAYQLSEGMARTQENARFAMDFLQRDIRMAGHFGCVNDQAHWVKEEGDPSVHVAAPSVTHPLNFQISIQGYEATGTGPNATVVIGSPAANWTPAVPGELAALNPLPGSDIIVLRYLGNLSAPISDISGAPGSETVNMPVGSWGALTDEGVANPTLFGIADCTHSTVFHANGGAGAITVAAAVPTTHLVDAYGSQPGSQTRIYRANSLVYYVGRGTSGEPALFRARADHTGAYPLDDREELVEGIESLQLLYGQDDVPTLTADTPPVGNITEQGTAAALLAGAGTNEAIANEWRRVGLVQVGILARSPAPAAAAEIASADNYIRIAGVEYQPAATNDTRYRSGYESTVALRNRLFGN